MEDNTQEEFEKTLEECRDKIADKVKAYIILAVTDEQGPNGTLGGINAVSGSEPELINLVLNIDKDLFRKAVIARAMSEARVVFDDEEDEEEPKILN